MKRTLAICTSHKNPTIETRAGLAAISSAGGSFRIFTGLADVALARNLYLTRCLTIAGEVGADLILLVDDDIAFTINDARAVVSQVRETGQPVSACYATNTGHLAAAKQANGRWFSGLGFLGLPLASLHELAGSSARVRTVNGEECICFTWTGPELGAEPTWYSEDYRFCERLGGVLLTKVAVGHVKPIALYPDPQSMDKFLGG